MTSLTELAADIKSRKGLQEPFVLWATEKGTVSLIDGRNRVAALAKLLSDDQLKYVLDPIRFAEGGIALPIRVGFPTILGPQTRTNFMFFPTSKEAFDARERIALPCIVRGRLVERAPERRPFPSMPEILLPDVIALLQRISERRLYMMDALPAQMIAA